MRKIGILIELNNDGIKDASCEVITAAQGPGNELYGILLGSPSADIREQVQNYGVEKIIDISRTTRIPSWNPSWWTNTIIQIMERFQIDTLLGLTSAIGKELLPRVAALLDAPLVLDCVEMDLANNTVKKSQFSGKIISTMKVTGSPVIFGIRPNTIKKRLAAASAKIIPFEISEKIVDMEVIEIKDDPSKAVDLTEAHIILSGGRAMKNAENFQILHECAEIMGAAVGASRVAVDSGWVPHSMQVGQTGRTVTPNLYIACGISGSVQHFAGMKMSKIIVAINTDREAPMMKNCDYGIIGDLYEIVPLLTCKLKEMLNPNAA